MIVSSKVMVLVGSDERARRGGVSEGEWVGEESPKHSIVWWHSIENAIRVATIWISLVSSRVQSPIASTMAVRRLDSFSDLTKWWRMCGAGGGGHWRWRHGACHLMRMMAVRLRRAVHGRWRALWVRVVGALRWHRLRSGGSSSTRRLGHISCRDDVSVAEGRVQFQLVLGLLNGLADVLVGGDDDLTAVLIDEGEVALEIGTDLVHFFEQDIIQIRVLHLVIRKAESILLAEMVPFDFATAGEHVEGRLRRRVS